MMIAPTRNAAKGGGVSSQGELAAEEEELWSLEKALEYVGENTTKEKVEKSKKATKKEKRKQKLRDRNINKKDSNPTENEDSNFKEDIAKEEDSNFEEETAKEEEQRREN